ncbi:MAG: RNA chaperone Hfq [Burkholderiaceae bacterium]
MQQADFIPPPDSSGRVQFAWLNRFRKERRAMEIFLVNGHRVAGRIRSFDQRAILLETPNGESILVFHEVVSTVQPVSRGAKRRPAPRQGAASRGPGDRAPERRRLPQEPPDYDDDDMPAARPAPPERKPVTIVRRTSRRIVRDDNTP